MSELRTREVEDLLNVLAGLNEPDEVFALLEDLFTIREIKDTSQRLEVARLLREGESYASIEKTTGASATTIARVSKALNYGTGGYQLALEVLKASEPVTSGLSKDRVLKHVQQHRHISATVSGSLSQNGSGKRSRLRRVSRFCEQWRSWCFSALRSLLVCS